MEISYVTLLSCREVVCKLEDLHEEATPLNSSNTEKMMVFPSSTASFSSLNFKPAAPNFDDEVCKHFHHIVLTCIPSTKQINSINNGRTNNTNRCLYFVFTIEDVGIWPKFWYLQNAEWMSQSCRLPLRSDAAVAIQYWCVTSDWTNSETSLCWITSNTRDCIMCHATRYTLMCSSAAVDYR